MRFERNKDESPEDYAFQQARMGLVSDMEYITEETKIGRFSFGYCIAMAASSCGLGKSGVADITGYDTSVVVKWARGTSCAPKKRRAKILIELREGIRALIN